MKRGAGAPEPSQIQHREPLAQAAPGRQHGGMAGLEFETILGLSRAYGAGEASPSEVTRAMLERIERLDPGLHAFTVVDPEGALAAAARADAAFSNGTARGPLQGVPIALKDLYFTRLMPTAAGMALLAGWTPDHDATVAERLAAAGAVLLGTLTRTEGAFVTPPPKVPVPVNPWDRARSTGLSSSGPGAALAAGLCYGALGSDTGGSIRFPSAACGLVGLKPTYGRVSRYGVFPLAASLDHVGPMTRSVGDAAVMLSAIAGADPRDPTTLREPVPDYLALMSGGVAGLSIGLDDAYCRDHADPEVAEAVLASVDIFQGLGATVRKIQLPPMDDLLRGFVSLVAVEAAVAHEPYYPERANEYGSLQSLLDDGLAVKATDYARVQAAGRTLSAQLSEVLSGVDALLCPSWPEPAPPIATDDSTDDVLDESGNMLKFTAPYNFSGHPTLSLPCGFTGDGLPLSLQLVGRHLSEDVLLRLGHAYEQATDWHTRHPDL